MVPNFDKGLAGCKSSHEFSVINWTRSRCVYVRKTDLGLWPRWTQYNNSIGVAVDYMLKLLHSSTQALMFWRRDEIEKNVDHAWGSD